MANCCLDTVAFFQKHTDREGFLKLCKAVKDCFPPERSYSESAFGILFDYAGLPKTDIYLRGTVIHVEVYDTYIDFDCDTAWRPLNAAYDAISKFYNVDYVFTSEEIGAGLYINTDTEGRFYDTRYKVVFYTDHDDAFYQTFMQNAGNDTDYFFSSERDLLDWFYENGGIRADSMKELKEMLDDEFIEIYEYMKEY